MAGRFGALVTAMVTPFREDHSLDLDAARSLAAHLYERGSESLVVAGSTGESPTLTHKEKLELFRAVIEVANGTGKVIAGTGTYSTAETLDLSHEAEELGADGLLLVTPYYNKPPQRGLLEHFSMVAEAVKIPIIAYNIPGRTGIRIEHDTLLSMAEVPNIVAIKEASGNLEQIAEILAGAPAGFRVYSGDDSATLALMGMGAYGVVSVVAHLAGKLIREMIEAMAGGVVDEAARLHARLLPLFQACFCTTNPIPVKAGLRLLGIPAGGVRLPLVDADARVIAEVRREMEKLGLLS